jgi:tetratricopeptide (TPR) repeat protein
MHMIQCTSWLLVVGLSLTVRAQDAAPAPATPAAPEAVPPVAEAPVDALVTARKIVEIDANTIANLKTAIDLYEKNLSDAQRPVAERVAGYADMARAYLRLGDKYTKDADKMAAYQKGRAAADMGLALDNNSAAATFWAWANQACVARTKGVMNSLFMIGDLKAGMKRTLQLDPNFHYARTTLGDIEHAVPGIAGGSDERAENYFMEALRKDPNFTPAMIRMARLKRDQGDKEAARSWAEKAKSAKSSIPNDQRKFDRKDADELLAEIQ